MQPILVALAFAGAAFAAPAALITPVPQLAERQVVGGALGGSVILPSLTLSGTLTGIVSSGIPYGCIGGAINGQGVTLCARDAAPTPPPQLAERQFQVGGAGHGSVLLPSLTLSGLISGFVNSATAAGCIGGIINEFGTQVCEGITIPTGL